MVLAKRIKEGSGSYYEGFELIVSSAAGSYVLDMKQTNSCGISSVSVTPDSYGTGDTYTLSHLTSDTTRTINLIAKNIYNAGGGVATLFDFPVFEKMGPGESIRLSYTNAASVAVNIHVLVEYAGILRTA